jgi:hypothetical protein
MCLAGPSLPRRPGAAGTVGGMSIRRRGKPGRYSHQVRVPGFPAITVPTRDAAEAVQLDLLLRKRLGHLYQERPRKLGRSWTTSSGYPGSFAARASRITSSPVPRSLPSLHETSCKS